MAQKLYVVWSGRQTGVFTDWATTQRAGAWLAGQDAAAAIQGDSAKQTPAHQRISTVCLEDLAPSHSCFHLAQEDVNGGETRIRTNQQMEKWISEAQH